MELFSSASKQKGNSPDAQIDELLVKLTNGDIDAMGPLYDMTSTSVYAFALSILKNSFDAEEVMHDCYVKLFSTAKSYSPQGKPMAYILSIVRNACINRLNDQKRVVPMSNDEPWEILLRVDEHPDNLLIAESMALLKEDEQQIVLLHAVSGFKHREIAAFLHLPLSTVLSKYTRSVRKLKKHFTERMDNNEA